jgi:hypothetical protein
MKAKINENDNLKSRHILKPKTNFLKKVTNSDKTNEEKRVK